MTMRSFSFPHFLALACPILSLSAVMSAQSLPASAPNAAAQEERMARLTLAVDNAEATIRASQIEIEALKQQLRQIKAEMVEGKTLPTLPAQEATSRTEQASLEESQIATLDQAKVESVSKFPFRVSGTILLNGFFNTGQVDQASAPTAVLANHNGTAGIAVRQTVLGFDTEGPHLLGAASHADLRVDFFGSGLSGGYATPGGLLRLRTVHATLNWPGTELFFSLDRPILNPETPESLVSIAQPELSWSGNLWNWVPQFGVTHTFGSRTRVRTQAAIIDPADPVIPSDAAPGSVPANTLAEASHTLAEASQRPGIETRLAVLSGEDRQGLELGFGGYFSPHVLTTAVPSEGGHFDAWAATIDYRFPLTHQLILSGNFYRGQALGGLGGGAYKDYLVRLNGSTLQFRPLDDVGGWSQLHQAINLRLQWNLGFGIDNGFAKELHTYPGVGSATLYQSIARNRTFFGNVIYSPRSSLLFSLEYRNLYTASGTGRIWTSNTTGLGAAYRF